MPKSTPLFDNQFWKVLRYLDDLNRDVSFREMKEVLELPQLPELVLFEVVAFLKNFDYVINAKKEGDDIIIFPNLERHRVMIDMSFSEWLAFQAHFPLLGEYADREIHKTVAEKLSTVELQYPDLDLFRYVEQEKGKREVLSKMDNRFADLVTNIDGCLANGLLLNVELSKGKSLEVFPHRLVYLDGDLSLIGEETNDRCLISLIVRSISDVQINIDTDYNNNFSNKEIDDFIYAIRAVSGNEERLVLKVNSRDKIDLKPPFHFLGNPYITSNMEGDLIWAASVEVSDELLEWLASINEHVDVLDPPSIRSALEDYINRKEKKPLKKAS